MDKLQKYAEQLASVPSEMRSSAAWQQCANEMLMRGGVGAAAGTAAALIFFRAGRSFGRGTAFGLSTGLGLGSAYEQCNERFLALQSLGGRGSGESK
jgi:hypothetical protein